MMVTFPSRHDSDEAVILSPTFTVAEPGFSDVAKLMVRKRRLPHFSARLAVCLPPAIFWLKEPHPSALMKAHLKFSGVSFGAKPMCCLGP